MTLKILGKEISIVRGAVGVVGEDGTTLYQYSPFFRKVDLGDTYDEADDLLECAKVGCRRDAMVEEEYCAIHLEEDEEEVFDTEPDIFEASKRDRER